MSAAVLYSLHCVQRARERYELDLGWSDLKDLMQRCARGEGLMETLPSGKRYHALILRDRVVWLVFSPRTGKIITVLPPAAGGELRRRDHQFMRRRNPRRTDK